MVLRKAVQHLAQTAALLLALLAAAPALADQGVTADEVRFVQIAALSGPAGPTGTGFQEGIAAAFAEANRAGGVHGRMLRLDTRDDGDDPSRSVAELRSVLQQDAHIALIGATGMPSLSAMRPLTTSAGLPMIGGFTGAAFLANPEFGNVFNLRARYATEVEEWVRLLVDDRGLKRIAVLYQDDSFGRDGVKGFMAAMERRGLTPVAEGTYMRDTLAVKAALIDIRRAKPQAVAMVGLAPQLSEFVLIAQSLEFQPVFICSADGIEVELGSAGAGLIISQIVPFPQDMSIPVVAAFHAALKASDPDLQPAFINFEGYLTGRLAVAALEAAGPALSRERYLQALRDLRDVDIHGLKLEFSPTDNQGLDDVFMTVIDPDGNLVPMTSG